MSKFAGPLMKVILLAKNVLAPLGITAAASEIDAGIKKKIYECPEYEVNSKIGNIFVSEKILKEYSVKIYEIDPYFHEHYRKRNTS